MSLDFLEELANEPSKFKILAIGDKKRFIANKMLLGKKCRYGDIAQANEKNTDIVVVCGEAPIPKLPNIPALHIYQIINYRAKKFWDNKKEYIGVDLSHHASNKHIVEYIDEYVEKYYAGRFQKGDKAIAAIKQHFGNDEKRKLKMLSLGCGCGGAERKFWETGIFSEIHGCDISDDSIKLAKEKAMEIKGGEAIYYFICDLNSDEFDNKYDVIFSGNCSHHVERLEFFYNNVKNALNPGGIFIQAEYTGAARFQHPRILIATINFLLFLMIPLGLVRRSCRRHRILADPSEAVRSDEIIPLTKSFFPDTKVHHNFPDIVLHLLYQCVKTSKFHDNRKRSRRLCVLTSMTERLITRLGLIKPNSAFLISRGET